MQKQEEQKLTFGEKLKEMAANWETSVPALAMVLLTALVAFGVIPLETSEVIKEGINGAAEASKDGNNLGIVISLYGMIASLGLFASKSADKKVAKTSPKPTETEANISK